MSLRSNDNSTAAASIAPAAPSAWPVTPFVETTGGPFAPNTLVIAAASAASFSGVEVPWARTYHRRRRQAALGRLTAIEFEAIIKPAADQAA